MTPAEFRAHFPIFRDRVYVNSCSQGALSDDVEAALGSFVESWRTGGSPWEDWVAVIDTLRREFAALVGASPDEVAITPSASNSIAAVATALDFGPPRQAVVLGDFEFPTAAHGWLAQQRRGAEIRWAAAHDHRLEIDAYDRVVDEHVQLVAATHVCFRNGHRIDVAALRALSHDRGALFLLDDYQATGTWAIDLGALGVDVFVTGALKYLLGTAGVAFLYVRRDLIPDLIPGVTGWFGRSNPFAFDIRTLDWSPSARRFEMGTPPVPNAYAALAGIRRLRSFGLAAVERQIADLTRRFIEGAGAAGYSILTPIEPHRRGPLVVLESHDAPELVTRLAARGIIASSRDRGLRVSFHGYNNDDDVDQVLRALSAESALLVREGVSQT